MEAYQWLVIHGKAVGPQKDTPDSANAPYPAQVYAVVNGL